jgi:hypothetical protein
MQRLVELLSWHGMIPARWAAFVHGPWQYVRDRLRLAFLRRLP